MGGVDGGDDHRLDLGVEDHTVAVVAEGADAELGSRLIRSGGNIVGHGDNRGSGDSLDNAAAMILADGAAADNADFQNLIHVYTLLIFR